MKRSALVLLALAVLLCGAFVHARPAQAASGVIQLRLSTHKPPVAGPVKAFEEWAQKIEKETGGKVKISIYTASSLVKMPDIIPATQRGICDIGDLVLHVEKDRYPLTTILNLPFLNLGSPQTCLKIWNDLEEKYPGMMKERNRFKVLYKQTSSAGQVNTTNKQVRLPEDVKGMKIIAQGYVARVLKSMGASPLAVGVPEWYSALDRGLAQGILLHYYGVYETKIYEHLPYHTNIGNGFALLSEELIMSWKTWNKLPPDVQKVFDDLSPWLTQRVWEKIDESTKRGVAVMKQAGQHFYTCTPEEVQQWYNAALPFHKELIRQLTAKGLPAQAIYDDALRLSKQYENNK